MLSVQGLVVAMIAWAVVPPEPMARLRLPSGIEVQIEEGPCAPAAAPNEARAVPGNGCQVRSGAAFGVQGPRPRTFVKRIAVVMGNRSYELDASGMYDAWGDRPLAHPGGVRYLGGWCADPSNCQIRGLFSDGTASFVAEWRIVDGKPIRTVLTDASDVIDLFMRNIDPPRFD